MPVHLKTALTLGAMVGFAVVLTACGERQSTQRTQPGASAAASASTDQSEPPVASALAEIPTPAAGQGAAAKTGQITEFALPSPISVPSGIAAGADGNLWVAQTGINAIARVTPAGAMTEFALPGGALPSAVVAGPDGNIWFAQRGGVGSITPTGVATIYKVDGIPSGITAGPDGNLWFTENFRGKIGRVTPSGQITLFDIPSRLGGGSVNPLSIAAGPDGNLWFTESNAGANKIGRITSAGVITEFAVPTAGSPRGIAAGPDGNLWFTADSSIGEARVAKITPAGAITEYALPLKNPQPMTITSGPDGNLWLTETNNPANKVARVTPTGSVTEFQVPTGFSGPYGIVAGPDGNLWFTERGKGRIGRLHAAVDDVRYVLHLASGFVPGTTTVALGQAVEWINQMPGLSSVRQAGTPPIFDSLAKGTGSTYTTRFAAAGTYAYLDHAHPSHTGTVAVPMTVAPDNGAQTTSFMLTWASGPDPVVPSGWLFDVQVAAPQAADFVPWQSGVTTKSAAYVPAAGPGVYRFRARLRHASAQSGSDWSPEVSITVR